MFFIDRAHSSYGLSVSCNMPTFVAHKCRTFILFNVPRDEQHQKLSWLVYDNLTGHFTHHLCLHLLYLDELATQSLLRVRPSRLGLLEV